MNNENNIKELNEQFEAFLKTKGISAKFKLAIENMTASAEAQHAADKASFEAVKARSAEENKDFVEFLHTKGIKAKISLVVENMKKGAAEASEKTAAQIKKSKAYIAQLYSAELLAGEFNAYLKAKGLEGRYSIVITEDK